MGQCPTAWPARRRRTCCSTRTTRSTGSRGVTRRSPRRARRDVPVLLSIGYAACHWCHVMAHESFEDAETAAYLNAHFVAVKVDREERPDVDAVYMEATKALTGHGGWPMTVFTTPEGRPFFCGTYFPPTPRHGMPSFRQLLASVAQTWRERRDEVVAAGQRIVDALASRAVVGAGDGCAAAGRRAARRRRALAGVVVRRRAGRLRRRAEVPAVDGARAAAAAPRAHRRRRAPCGWSRAPARRWPAAASTTSSPAASRATPSTPAGSCRTSRRCSTTTRCCCGSTRTCGGRPVGRSPAGSRWRPPTGCCATCAPPRAASPPRWTPTPTASRG